jgi:hypothetical protein
MPVQNKRKPRTRPGHVCYATFADFHLAECTNTTLHVMLQVVTALYRLYRNAPVALDWDVLSYSTSSYHDPAGSLNPRMSRYPLGEINHIIIADTNIRYDDHTLYISLQDLYLDTEVGSQDGARWMLLAVSQSRESSNAAARSQGTTYPSSASRLKTASDPILSEPHT